MDGAAFDEFEGLFAAAGDVLGIFGAGEFEFHLFPHHGEDFFDGEEFLPEESLGENDEGGALDEGVVDVEKCCGSDILGDIGIGDADVDGAGRFDGAGDGVDTCVEFVELHAVDRCDGLGCCGFTCLALGGIVYGGGCVVFEKAS